MKKVLMFISAAALFAACSNNDEAILEQATAQQGQIPVVFDAYAGRALTRAGVANDVDIASLQTNGFGVFAYYTDNSDYEQASTPNFMYNEKVSFSSPNWQSATIKYWPNEYGTTAISDATDKLSFFAYAPYVGVTANTGKVAAGTSGDEDKWGIVGMSRNTAAGDPIVKYIVSFDPTKSVDLVWGTVHSDFAGTGKWKTTQGTPQDLTAGMPWLNIERPADATGTDAGAQKVKFDFKHATAKLNAQIALYADGQTFATGSDVNAKTKVYVRQINISGIATKAALNLNNTVAGKALWLDYAGVNDLETSETVTIFDGRKDGKEAVAGAVATNEKQLGLNDAIIQTNETTTGVKHTPYNLFKGTDKDKSVYVIPTGEAVNIEIVYDVETQDDNLAGYLSDGKTHGSVVENRIRKETVFPKLENGKAYTLKLYLGMNSVKFDAAVADWGDPTEAQPNLPANKND